MKLIDAPRYASLRAIGGLLLCVLGAATPGCGNDLVGEDEPPASSPSASADPTSGPAASLVATTPVIGGCALFPSNNPWNTDISAAPVDPNSANYIASMNGGTKNLHPDFGSDPSYGIPWITVPSTQPLLPITFTYADESDPGPYPFPPNAPIEVGDAHVLVVEEGKCLLYESYNSSYASGAWQADSGAKFNLNSNALRPDGWTSADAAGLPILPGLARRSEVLSGTITHALRFTAHATQHAYVHPATHDTGSSTNANLPPMGLRVRLKASYDLSKVTGDAKVILTALKKYGMFLADNGSDWFISGETNTAWDDNDLGQLKKVPASAFEVVKLGTIYH